ncbi:MAG: hypothetical protein JW863_04025 [Chitinispirillaceae bacterium]|nr:hypothetical protein [Chitinispirillaceae bacterium]
MSVLQLLIVLVVIGFVLWLINSYIPMDGKIKKIFNIVAVIMVILWLLNVFGVFGSEQWNMHLGNLHMGIMYHR